MFKSRKSYTPVFLKLPKFYFQTININLISMRKYEEGIYWLYEDDPMAFPFILFIIWDRIAVFI
jgi:hypothetical protein